MKNWVRLHDLNTSRIECLQRFTGIFVDDCWRVTGASGRVYWVRADERTDRALHAIRHKIFQSGL